jgi:hypothetical protein
MIGDTQLNVREDWTLCRSIRRRCVVKSETFYVETSKLGRHSKMIGVNARVRKTKCARKFYDTVTHNVLKTKC